jgi:hypothetical protein
MLESLATYVCRVILAMAVEHRICNRDNFPRAEHNGSNEPHSQDGLENKMIHFEYDNQIMLPK